MTSHRPFLIKMPDHTMHVVLILTRPFNQLLQRSSSFIDSSKSSMKMLKKEAPKLTAVEHLVLIFLCITVVYLYLVMLLLYLFLYL